jgi:hypothetical protein
MKTAATVKRDKVTSSLFFYSHTIVPVLLHRNTNSYYPVTALSLRRENEKFLSSKLRDRIKNPARLELTNYGVASIM